MPQPRIQGLLNQQEEPYDAPGGIAGLLHRVPGVGPYLADVVDPPSAEAADLDRDAAYAAQDRLNKRDSADLSEYGYVSWEEHTDPVFDEEGDETSGETYALITRTEVYPPFRGQGYGKRLVRNAIREIQREQPDLEIKLFPQVFDRENNALDDEELVRFYESLGFAVDESSPIGVMEYVGPDLSSED